MTISQQQFDIQHHIAHFGWAIENIHDALGKELLTQLQQLDLPEDPYAPPTIIRRRMYSKMAYIPATNEFIDLNSSTYHQTPELNEDAGGIYRHFAPLPKKVRTALTETAQFVYPIFDLSTHVDMWLVGMHLVDLVAKGFQPGVSSPNALHQDGEHSTAVILIDRQNIVGGESLVGSLEGAVLHRTTLKAPGECLFVLDEAITHAVEPIRVKHPANTGTRRSLLIDFTPFVPKPNVYKT